ncbi:hypothetical protein AgCh_007164 [Apium graveolens]
MVRRVKQLIESIVKVRRRGETMGEDIDNSWSEDGFVLLILPCEYVDEKGGKGKGKSCSEQQLLEVRLRLRACSRFLVFFKRLTIKVMEMAIAATKTLAQRMANKKKRQKRGIRGWTNLERKNDTVTGRISYNNVVEVNGRNKDQGRCLRAEKGCLVVAELDLPRRRLSSQQEPSTGGDILWDQIHQDLHTPLPQMSNASSARSYRSSRSSSSPAHTSASPACSSATPSPLNQYPPKQRGSKDFQSELTSLFGRLSQPISPGSAITPQGALNISRVENSMRAAGSGSLNIHLDPNPEDFTREKNIYDWRNRPVDLSHIPASLGVEELLNREPTPLDKERAEEILREMAGERAARLRQAAANSLDPIHLDSESTDSDLGSAYYDTRKKGKEPIAAEYPILGLEGEEDGSHWSYDSPQSEEVADVTSQYKICNYNYIPAASPKPYVPLAQPELEGEIVFKRQIIPDGEESSTVNEEVKVLACRDLPTSLT